MGKWMRFSREIWCLRKGPLPEGMDRSYNEQILINKRHDGKILPLCLLLVGASLKYRKNVCSRSS